MHSGLNAITALLAATDTPAWLENTLGVIWVVLGFSVIIFVHELGHFLAAKWVGIRVDRFAIGFGNRLCGWRQGEGFTFGGRPNYTGAELEAKNWGETDYCLKLLPLGGYVKMLGQDDIQINDDTGEVKLSDDPRAFTNKPVGKRMLVVSAGVIFNVLFAILTFMCVFLMGKSDLAAQIGALDPVGPAAKAGLRSGDLVVEANGRPIETFRDLIIAQILAQDGRVSCRVQRDGQLIPDEFVIELDSADSDPFTASGMRPFGTTKLLINPREDIEGDYPRKGDLITRVNGEAVSSSTEIELAFTRHLSNTGKSSVELTIERPDSDAPSKIRQFTCSYPTALLVGYTQTEGTREARVDSGHILGLCPRRKVIIVDPGGPGDKADIKPGDVVAQWGSVPNPLYSEIVTSIYENVDQPVNVIVEREGQREDLTVTARRPFTFFKQADPRIGVGFGRIEEQRAVVADVASGTPAASLNMPRGAEILSINGQAVASWFDVIQKLKAAAGTTVTVRYRSGGDEADGRMAIPSSIVNELSLPPGAMIISINGKSSARLEDETPVRLPNPVALQTLLEKYLGETVKIEYQISPRDHELHPAEFTVRADGSNIDPWQMRILYSHDLLFAPKERLVQTSNPVKAIQLGVKHTGLVLVEVYRVIKSMARNAFSERSTAQHVSGPVGIVSAAITKAKQGAPELLFFLAFLSVNLAVINFLPFPVVDGGLMVFLLIEKVKGKPLGLKTQMWATLIGLATIILVFLLVTIQDISKIWSS
ncbi:MAG: site-2 protease family protein [Planctomycetota bacterium]